MSTEFTKPYEITFNEENIITLVKGYDIDIHFNYNDIKDINK